MITASGGKPHTDRDAGFRAQPHQIVQGKQFHLTAHDFRHARLGALVALAAFLAVAAR